jgi:hypothetical protein
LLRIAEMLWFLPPALLIIGIAFVELAPDLRHLRRELWMVFVALLTLVVLLRVTADIVVRSFRCPRCGKPFVRLSILERGPLYTIKQRFPCQHCRLPVGAASGDVDRASAR